MTKTQYDDRGLPVGMHHGPRRPLPDGLGAPEVTAEELMAGREMSNAIVQAQGAHQAVLASQRDVVHKARACGEKLIELRNKVGERDWPDWVARNAGFPLAKARFYTKLAQLHVGPGEGRAGRIREPESDRDDRRRRARLTRAGAPFSGLFRSILDGAPSVHREASDASIS